MCGIIGTINFNINTHKALNLIQHRGPNSQTHCSYGNVDFFHTRLSIQDIDNGDQPFSIGNYTIIFNGEIYNHMSLRSKLKKYTCVTRCDTETLLALFIENGMEFLKDCDGMFAFAILDKKKNKIFLARDRSGKKPLYIYRKKESIIFASELNVFKGLIGSIEIDRDAIYSYIRNGFIYKTYTPYKNISELTPGYFYCIDIDSIKVTKNQYFNYLEYYKKEKILDKNLALEKIDTCLHKSIKDRLLSSDIEVGAFLSGGIDSSLIVAIASNYVDRLRTFTVKFDGLYDESKLARLTARKYNTKHTELDISMNLKYEVEDILLNYGEPFMDSSAIPSYYISKEAKKHVNVILNGDGADEIFGGYRRYIPAANSLARYMSILSGVLPLLPYPKNKRSFYDYIYRAISMANKQGIDFYNSSTNNIFEDVYDFNNNSVFKDMNNFISQVELEKISNLSKSLYMDFNLILTSDLLKKMDIAAMSNSLESRSPFLSKYMLELAPTLSDNFKISGSRTKPILRDLSKKYLDNSLIDQPKRGFEVPLQSWVENDLKENIFDRLNSNCFSREFINWDFIKKVLDNKVRFSGDKRSKILWTLYCLEVWKGN